MAAADATAASDGAAASDSAADSGDATAPSVDTIADGAAPADAAASFDADAAGDAPAADAPAPCLPGPGACDDGNPCTLDSCDKAAGQCTHSPLASGTACSDGNPCTTQDQCAGGACSGAVASDGTACAVSNDFCVVSLGCQAGSCVIQPMDCTDQNPCTVDTCDPGAGCQNGAANDGIACTGACQTGATCTQGNCVGTVVADGTPCDDGDPCTLADLCAGGGCSGTPAPKGTPCTSSNACLSETVCGVGGCWGYATDCNDGNPCTYDNCLTGSGKCSHMFAPDETVCIDNNGCAGGKCSGGACNVFEYEIDGNPCNDGNPCTSLEKCAAGSCAGTELATVCDDSDACTADACVAGKASKPACTHTPIGNCVVTTIFEDGITCGDLGWTIAPVAAAGKSGWAIDNQPAPGSFSAGCSLNFNNNVDYDDGVAVAGTATSKAFTLSGDQPSKLAFWSYNGVNDGPTYDVRTVAVSDDGFGVSQQTWPLDDAGQDKWKMLTFDLSAWQGKTIAIRFGFATKDAFENAGSGWFIDDVHVWHSAP